MLQTDIKLTCCITGQSRSTAKGRVRTKRKGRYSYLSIWFSCKGRILNRKRVLSSYFPDAGSPLLGFRILGARFGIETSRCRMPRITNEITGLQGNLGRDVGVESLTYWGLSKVILKKEDTKGTWESNSIIVIVVKSIAGYCGRQEEPAILISRLLWRMRRIYVASIYLDFHEEWMECTERNLITRVWT